MFSLMLAVGYTARKYAESEQLAASRQSANAENPELMTNPTIDDIKTKTLFFREKGAGTPVLFIPSYLLDSRCWLDQLDELSDSNRCIAPDLRGHGQSIESVRRTFAEEEDAADLIALLETECNGEPAHIVGLAGGGVIAALIYLHAPHLVKSLALMSTNFIVSLDKSYKNYQKELARTAVIEGYGPVFRRFNEYIVAAGADLLARARYKTMLTSQSYELIVSFMNSDAIQARPEIPEKLDVPVFLPYGDEDIVMTPENVEKLLNTYPNASTTSVANAGRLLPLENPTALNEALRNFWRNID